MSGGHIPFSHKGRSTIHAIPSKGSIWLMIKQMFNRVPSKWKFWSQALRRAKTAHCHCQGTFKKSANHHS